MKETVLHTVQCCQWCLQRKDGGNVKFEKKRLYAEYPYQKVFLDLTGPLPMTNCGNRYILAILDGYSKWATLIPLKNANAETISRAFLKHWVAIYGPPERIHSDRGLSFLNEKVNEICATLKIRHSTSSPYYPQGNSMVERLFKTIKDFIYCTTRDQACEWDSILWMVELSL